MHVANYERVHYDTKSDVVVLKVMSKENTFTRAIQGKWLNDKYALGIVHDKEVKTPMYAFKVGVIHRSLKGLDPRISPDKAYSGRTRIPPTQEHLWDVTSGS